jgi:AraC-like DNA-binding protein
MWLQRSTRTSQLAIPNASAEIVCDLVTGHTFLVGPLTHPRRSPPTDTQVRVGVRFRPGAPASLLGARPQEIRDLEIPLEDSWGRAAVRLGEQLAGAGSVQAAYRVLVDGIRSRVRCQRDDAFSRELVERLQPWSAGTVASASRDLFFSDRQLRRRCWTLFGFTPKELQRLLRFQVFLAVIHGFAAEPIQLGRLAVELGYADQSHLSRECHALSGLAPRALVRALSASCGAAHDHTVSFASLRGRFLQDRPGSVVIPSPRCATTRPTERAFS